MSNYGAAGRYRATTAQALVSGAKLARCFAILAGQLKAEPVYLVDGEHGFYTTVGRITTMFRHECIGWFDRFATFEELAEAAEHTARGMLNAQRVASKTRVA